MNILLINQAFNPSIIIFGNESKIIFSIIYEPSLDFPNPNLFLISKMLQELKLDKTLINGIAVVYGPGSFTGTRVSVVEAKIISFALNIPLFAINSIDCLGIHTKSNSLVVIPAYRNEYFAARFVNGKRKSNDKIISMEELVNSELTICSTEEKLKNYVKRFSLIKLEPKKIITLAFNKAEKREYVRDPLSLNPLYLRTTDMLYKKIR